MSSTTHSTTPPQAPAVLSTTDQLCEHYQISRTTFWRLSQKPGFPQPYRIGRILRWDADAIRAFLIQQQAA